VGGEARASDTVHLRSTRGTFVDGDRPMAAVQVVFAVTYYTPALDADDVQLDEFKTANVKTSLGGTVAPGNQAEDKVENLDQ
jgi:hypothetical protein